MEIQRSTYRLRLPFWIFLGCPWTHIPQVSSILGLGHHHFALLGRSVVPLRGRHCVESKLNAGHWSLSRMDHEAMHYKSSSRENPVRLCFHLFSLYIDFEDEKNYLQLKCQNHRWPTLANLTCRVNLGVTHIHHQPHPSESAWNELRMGSATRQCLLRKTWPQTLTKTSSRAPYTLAQEGQATNSWLGSCPLEKAKIAQRLLITTPTTSFKMSRNCWPPPPPSLKTWWVLANAPELPSFGSDYVKPSFSSLAHPHHSDWKPSSTPKRGPWPSTKKTTPWMLGASSKRPFCSCCAVMRLEFGTSRSCGRNGWTCAYDTWHLSRSILLLLSPWCLTSIPSKLWKYNIILSIYQIALEPKKHHSIIYPSSISTNYATFVSSKQHHYSTSKGAYLMFNKFQLLVASIDNGWAQISKGLTFYDPTTDQLLEKTRCRRSFSRQSAEKLLKYIIDPNIHYDIMSHTIPCPLLKSFRIESECFFHRFKRKEPCPTTFAAEKSHLASSIPPNPKHITQWQHTSFHRISTQALLQLCKHSTPQCMLFTSTHLMPNKHTGRNAKQNCQWKILWFVAFFGRWGGGGRMPEFPHLAMIQEEHLSYPTWRWPFDWLERNQL